MERTQRKDLMQKINAAQAVLHQEQEENEENDEGCYGLGHRTNNATHHSNILEKMFKSNLRKEKSKQEQNFLPDAKSQSSKPQNMVTIQTLTQIMESPLTNLPE